MTDMMKQHCLQVKKPLRAFVLLADSWYSRKGEGVVLWNSKPRSGSWDFIPLSLFSIFFFSNMFCDNNYR